MDVETRPSTPASQDNSRERPAAVPTRADNRAEVDAERRFELNRFKTDVSLSQFAASRGYQTDRKESSAASTVMRHEGTGDKIVVNRAKDGHWQYFSVRDARDSGTIIDFLQHREGLTLSQVRKEVRAWAKLPETTLPKPERLPRPVVVDRSAVQRVVSESRAPDRHPYLEARGLSAQTLSHPRFQGTWRTAGGRANVIFPHRDAEGVSGFEIKNEGFTGFSKGGKKGLWASKASKVDDKLVVVESAIDALSYQQVHRDQKARYLSTSGQLNAAQANLLERAVKRMQSGALVVAATDRDPTGDAMASRLEKICAKHEHVRFERHTPNLGKDWNDHLRAMRSPPLPARAATKSPGLDR